MKAKSIVIALISAAVLILLFLLIGSIAHPVWTSKRSTDQPHNKNTGSAIPNSTLKLKTSVDPDADICGDVQKMIEDNTLNKIIIASPQKYARESFSLDIDNDRQDEELVYKPGPKTMHLYEVSSGKRYGLPTGFPNANYSGTNIVRYESKTYLLHNGLNHPSELSELFSDNKSSPRRFIEKTVCDFDNKIF